MRIAIIYHNLVMRGGATRQVLELARNLLELGHSVTVYTYRHKPSACYPELAEGLDLRCIIREEQAVGRVASFLLRLPFGYFWESRRLARKIRATDYDVLNPHDRRADRTAKLAARRSGVPIAWTVNDLRPQSLDFATPAYYVRHPLTWARDKVALLAERFSGGKAKTILVQSGRFRAAMERLYPGKVRVVPVGVDLPVARYADARHRVREGLKIGWREFVVLSIGVLFPVKRFEDVIQALSLLRSEGFSPRLVIAGDGRVHPQYHRLLEALVRREKLEGQVNLVNKMLSEGEVCELLAACDAFVFASDQTWGLAPLEALLFGKPTIVSQMGVHEVLREGETALLVPPHDPAAMARSLKRLMRDPALREKLGRQGRAFVRENLSWRRYAEDMVDVYKSVRGEATGARFVDPPRELVPGKGVSK